MTVAGRRTEATTKTATLTFRITPEVKEAPRTAVQQEHRSIANRVEVSIRNHCEEHGIAFEAPAVTEIIKDQPT